MALTLTPTPTLLCSVDMNVASVMMDSIVKWVREAPGTRSCIMATHHTQHQSRCDMVLEISSTGRVGVAHAAPRRLVLSGSQEHAEDSSTQPCVSHEEPDHEEPIYASYACPPPMPYEPSPPP